jgi:serine phosphatase RsbU (regulator of sigma subunit)
LLASARGDGPEWALAIAELRGWVRGRADLGTRELHRELDRRRQEGNAGLLRVFYCRYEPRTRSLGYVNSGYPAPFVLRRTPEGGQVLRLSPGAGEAGAPVVEGAFALLPGDLVVAASRGIVQASNQKGETWGEGRLIETLLAWESQRSTDIVQLVLRTVQGFAASVPGADRAIVVLRPPKPGLPDTAPRE